MKNCKGFGRKWPWPNFKVLRKTIKNLKQDSRLLGLRIELGPPEYEA
jgi:hypothetical protein